MRLIKLCAKRIELSPDLTSQCDSTSNETDLLHHINNLPYAHEIKSSSTYSPDFFKGITKWAKLSGASPPNALPSTTATPT